MARVGIKGYIASGVKAALVDVRSGETVPVPAIPVLDWIIAQLENTLNGQLDSTNLADSAVSTAKLQDLSVTAAKIALATITSAQTADGVGQTASVQYTGDGTTANRVVALSFTPRYVKVIRTDATFLEFESIAVAAVSTNWYRDSTGAQAASTANWQGIVVGGVKLGTSAVGTSNAAGVTYTVYASK